MEIKKKVKMLAFEKCPHCTSTYLWFIMVGKGTTAFTAVTVYSRAQAFGLLKAFSAISLEPLTETEYARWANLIVEANLDEYAPSDEICEKRSKEHGMNKEWIQEIIGKVQLLHYFEINPSPNIGPQN